MFESNFDDLIIKNYSPIYAKGGKRMRRRSYKNKKSRRCKTNKNKTRRRYK
jgi:hypothetical protein